MRQLLRSMMALERTYYCFAIIPTNRKKEEIGV